MAQATVRDAAIEVFRARGLTRMFANPGSTEVPLLVDLPPDLEFVLALHEGSVVGIATGWAIGRSEPALVLLHTTAGLGNAVGALATARVNRAPLVVLVGQQDRRHLAHEPFLAGRLEGLAGTYPVSVEQPVRPQDVPGAIGRAWHAATTGRGPALVIVPMDDWSATAPDESDQAAAAGTVLRAAAVDPAAVDALVALLAPAERTAVVVGAGADEQRAWDAVVEIAEKLDAPVWQESFGARAGFPQDHPRFAGHLPSDRTRLRAVLEPFDAVLVVGAAAFRQYTYVPGPFHGGDTRVAVVTDDAEEAHRSVAELVVLAPVAAACEDLAARLPRREAASSSDAVGPRLTPAAAHNPLTTAYVFSALAERLPQDAVVLEEAPSSKPELHARIAARAPLGFVSPAMGGLGFAIPAAIGIRMARPERPVLAIAGDGASLYAIQALWTAAHYRVGALFVIMANGGYAVMDRLAELHGGTAVWPRFPEIDLSGIARAFGCPARRVGSPAELEDAFDEIVPGLAERDEPLFLEVAVAPDEDFVP
jgi:thiamine pyrophosphate-dependent acetolactate synthase large subunit-like protein